MSEMDQETIDTYNRSAVELAEYFRGIGPRADDIERAFKLVGEPVDKVLEIGCGDGRDAAEIVPRTKWYLGFDASEAMVKLAQKYVPTGEFEVGKADKFWYPPDLDLVFAFASLLHLSKKQLPNVFEYVGQALRNGGIFYISLKYAKEYREEIKEDQYGRRLFYFYNPEMIQDIAGNNFESVYQSQETKGNTEWFEIALKKID